MDAFTKFTVYRFLGWKRDFSVADPNQSDRNINLNIVKYCFAIGDYNKSYIYLKQICDEHTWEKLVTLKWSHINNNDRNIWSKSKIVSRLSNIGTIDNDDEAFVPKNRKIIFSNVLQLLYNYSSQNRNLFDSDVRMWIIIGKFLEHLAYFPEDVTIFILNPQYACLVTSFGKFCRTLVRNDLFYILDYHGFLTNKLLVDGNNFMFFKQYLINILVSTIDQGDVMLQPLTNTFINGIMSSNYYLKNRGTLGILFRLYELCIKFKYYEGVLLCLGVNFSCDNVTKIEIRSNFEKFKILYDSQTFGIGYKLYPHISGKLMSVILGKLEKFREKFPLVFILKNNLDKLYQDICDQSLINLDDIYPYISRVVDLINNCYNFLAEEQKYRPNEEGYFESQDSYNNRVATKI